MYRQLVVVIAFMLSVLLMPLSANAAENETVTLDVPGMTCEFCPITIRKALKKIPGVIDAKSDFKTKTATVTFDPDKTNVEALTKATANAGYPSTVKIN